MQTEVQASERESLIRLYEDAYVTHLEASEGGVDLEDRLNVSLALQAATTRMQAAGLEEEMKEIQESLRD
ncbi:hypothetical protein [Piscinibacter gummiphilus]|uniref:Uncharacterized protein n=1 Tax=Piscinibacter gummiphilus TaxID=946333 RepID=A0ABZ0D365_9BURK|nr:hypothetical protein [Piscinibacter gummiphilus]WOB11241.1 hypothetical protein RXV79_26785 [Piscinibacter gummiphilus]